jgi:hypothetical protein
METKMQENERLQTNGGHNGMNGQKKDNGPDIFNVKDSDKLTEGTIKEEPQAIGMKQEKEDFKEEKEERLYQQRAALAHAKAVTAQRLGKAFVGFEEILRILHSTNWRNQPLLKKNIAEIELICKNALLELKGL